MCTGGRLFSSTNFMQAASMPRAAEWVIWRGRRETVLPGMAVD